MQADHSSRGILKSGNTIKEALRIAEELATSFVKAAFDAVSDVAMDVQAFNMVFTDVTIILAGLKVGVDEAVSFTTGARQTSAAREANRLFLDLQQRVLRLAEIRRFEFTRPAPSTKPLLGTAPAAADIVTRHKNRGGAPLASHWDEMWADIAVQLWEGDLKPTRQKDITDAMFAWLNARELDAGNTAVTDRARALWQKVEERLRG